MKTHLCLTDLLSLVASLCVTACPLLAEDSTILLEDFETHFTGYLDPPWIGGVGGSVFDNPRVMDDGSGTNRIVRGHYGSFPDGATRPMPFAFSTSQSSVLYQFEGRTTTNGEPDERAGASLSLLEFRDDTSTLYFFGFGLHQSNLDGVNPAPPPSTILIDATGTSHFGDTLEPEKWYEFRGLIDWTAVDSENHYGLFTLLYRERGASVWITDSSLANRRLKVAAPELATQLGLRVDQVGYSQMSTWHQGQMDNIGI